MKKILAVIIISITILLCGCGVTNNLMSWGSDTYKADNGKEYYVFTSDKGGIFVIEK